MTKRTFMSIKSTMIIGQDTLKSKARNKALELSASQNKRIYFNSKTLIDPNLI